MPSTLAVPPSESSLRAPFVELLADCVRSLVANGKLDDDAVDRGLTAPARAWVEGACEATRSTPLADVESLVALVASQVGGEAGLVERADPIVAGWASRAPIASWLRASEALVDGPGFVVSQASEWLVVSPEWTYAGGREGFEVAVHGLPTASPGLRALLGALLARVAACGSKRTIDVRVHGVDGGPLVIAGHAPSAADPDPAEECRLHRAALAG
jgi:hypothetical protein